MAIASIPSPSIASAARDLQSATRPLQERCHGLELEGSKQGPPLLHPLYKPSHHDDKSFYRAALKGVRQHHWNFGDMPAVPGVTPGKMDRIVPYLRYYQKQKKLY